MAIIKCSFPEKQYCKEKTVKTQIVLHHTVSSNASSPIAHWETTPERVATSYVVAKDGTIYEVFNSDFWAYHIGKGSTIDDNKKSIGIEIVNEGILTNHGLKWAFGTYHGLIYEHPHGWRGSKYFAPYTEAQHKAIKELISMLTKKHDIPLQYLVSWQYDKANFNFMGILSHHNLRPDKTDVSPAFDFSKLQ